MKLSAATALALAFAGFVTGCAHRESLPAAPAAPPGKVLRGPVDEEDQLLYRSEVEATTNIVVAQPPPPPPTPLQEISPAPTAPDNDSVWIEGHWTYTNRHYVWVEGYWTYPPARGRSYVPPHWKAHRGSYVYIEGYWR